VVGGGVTDQGENKHISVIIKQSQKSFRNTTANICIDLRTHTHKENWHFSTTALIGAPRYIRDDA
jgi:hypothetical protein